MEFIDSLLNNAFICHFNELYIVSSIDSYSSIYRFIALFIDSRLESIN